MAKKPKHGERPLPENARHFNLEIQKIARSRSGPGAHRKAEEDPSKRFDDPDKTQNLHLTEEVLRALGEPKKGS